MEHNLNIHFIAGLPRSGSTLLASILRQNPRFHAEMSGPLEFIYGSALIGLSPKNHFHTFITVPQRERVLKGIVDSFYADVPQEHVVFDTNRSWPMRLPSITRLFPNARIICCVRDVASVLNSFEHLVEQNPYDVPKLFDPDPWASVYGRTERLMRPNGSVGMAYQALKEAYYGEHANRLFFVEFESLLEKPEKTLQGIYSAIGESYFPHDFESVHYEQSEFDAQLGLHGMHTINAGVGKKVRNTKMIVPPDIVKRYHNAEFWRQ
jgi:sulfotransferase